MKFVPNAVSTKVARAILVGQKHSPTILFAGGVVGVVATTVTACKATLKVEDVLKEHEVKKSQAKAVFESVEHQKYTEKDYKQDMLVLHVQTVVKLTKLYAPSILLGAASIAMLTGSHNILNKRNAALTAAYTTVEKSFREYRERVVDEYGEDKDRELYFGVKSETELTEDKNGPKKKQVKKAGGPSMYAQWFDSQNENYSPQAEYNVLFLRGQQNYANQRLQAKGHLFLNEVLDDLGIKRVPEGQIVGWVLDADGDGYVDFGVFTDDGLNKFKDFILGVDGALLLDFNVDGPIWEKI